MLRFVSVSTHPGEIILKLCCFKHDNPTMLALKQKLSYRKQVARKLRTQYAEGSYDNPVTLKSRLTVIQGHWKGNH